MTAISELDHAESVKMNQHSECLGHSSFNSKAVILTHRQVHKPDSLLYLDY